MCEPPGTTALLQESGARASEFHRGRAPCPFHSLSAKPAAYHSEPGFHMNNEHWQPVIPDVSARMHDPRSIKKPPERSCPAVVLIWNSDDPGSAYYARLSPLFEEMFFGSELLLSCIFEASSFVNETGFGAIIIIPPYSCCLHTIRQGGDCQ